MKIFQKAFKRFLKKNNYKNYREFQDFAQQHHLDIDIAHNMKYSLNLKLDDIYSPEAKITWYISKNEVKKRGKRIEQYYNKIIKAPKSQLFIYDIDKDILYPFTFNKYKHLMKIKNTIYRRDKTRLYINLVKLGRNYNKYLFNLLTQKPVYKNINKILLNNSNKVSDNIIINSKLKKLIDEVTYNFNYFTSKQPPLKLIKQILIILTKIGKAEKILENIIIIHKKPVFETR